MNKRSRAITGWRQLPRAASSSRKRPSQPATVAAVVVAHPPVEPPPKQQWETEGGTVAKPAKPPVKKTT
jgi:hypothetical protein